MSGATTLAFTGLFAVAAPMTHAYTLKETEGGTPVRWRVRTVPLRIDRRLERRFGSDVRRAVEISVEAWRGLDGVPDVVVVDGEPPAAGYADGPAAIGNGVYVLDDWPYDPTQLAVTVTTFEETSGRLLDADIFLNGEKLFALLDEGAEARRADCGSCGGGGHVRDAAYDLGAVLTHEVGHVLGLGESLDDEAATMWPRIGQSETHQRTIEEDDELGVIAAYASAGSGAPATLACGTSLVSGRSPIDRSSAASWLFSVALLAGWRRLRRPHMRSHAKRSRAEGTCATPRTTWAPCSHTRSGTCTGQGGDDLRHS